MFDSDYSHIEESRFEYCEVLWTGDKNPLGFWVGGWRMGEFDVSGVEAIVDLKILLSSFLLLINSCSNVMLDGLAGAKKGLTLVGSVFFGSSFYEGFVVS